MDIIQKEKEPIYDPCGQGVWHRLACFIMEQVKEGNEVHINTSDGDCKITTKESQYKFDNPDEEDRKKMEVIELLSRFFENNFIHYFMPYSDGRSIEFKRSSCITVDLQK